LEPSGADTNGDTESKRRKKKRKGAPIVLARSVSDEAISVFLSLIHRLLRFTRSDDLFYCTSPLVGEVMAEPWVRGI